MATSSPFNYAISRLILGTLCIGRLQSSPRQRFEPQSRFNCLLGATALGLSSLVPLEAEACTAIGKLTLSQIPCSVSLMRSHW